MNSDNQTYLRCNNCGEYVNESEAAAHRCAPAPRRKKPKREEKPFVLVTVSGGVASVWCPKGVEYDIIDWDNYEQDLPTRYDLDQMREIAKHLQSRAVKKFLLGQIQELEDRGVADED